MADIKQAAKWMDDRKQRGKSVRRKSEPLEVFTSSEHFDGAIFMSRCEEIGGFARLTREHLLATDWEIVSESCISISPACEVTRQGGSK
jgi:hypothetical protein